MAQCAPGGDVRMLGLTIILLFVAGYTTQRASVCAVAAAQEMVRYRRANRLLGALLSAAVSTVVLATIAVAGNPVFARFAGHAVMVTSLIGGCVFAVGAWINRRCAMGTLAELAAGNAPRLGTIIGMFAGFALGYHLLKPWMSGMMDLTEKPSLASMVAPATVLAIAVGVSLALYALLRTGLRGAPPPRFWHPVTAVAIAGIASGLLFALDRRWPYTSLIGDLAIGRIELLSAAPLFAAIVLAGSCVAALRGGLFIGRPGTVRDWAGALVGGLGMGVGASLVPGGNDSMLYMGLPLALPNLATAYAACTATLILLAWMSQRRRLNA